MKAITDMSKEIGFGGGCHWCTEGVFQILKGVLNVDQGWVSSTGENEAYSEGVIVTYDPELIPLEILIEVHLITHSSTSNHSMRAKYRSAVYGLSESENEKIRSLIKDLQCNFEKPLITQVLKLVSFKRNKEKFLNYYKNQPEAPFCKSHIEPKLQKLIKTHNQYIINPTTL